jgi:aminopeptidase N
MTSTHSTRLSIRRILFLASWLIVTAAHEAPAQERFRFDSTPGHLSRQVVPQRCALTLDLDPDKDVFTGQARIDLRVRQALPSIELHAHELSAASARLVGTGAARVLRVTPLPESQTWRLEPVDGRPIGAGAQRLEIAYTGKVNVAGQGLFAAPYEVGGRPQRMLATQLEAIHARQLFPAFDEPSFRTVFEIAVRAPNGVEVVSNMPRVAGTAGSGTTLHRFAPTPPMPSYLVSVAVGRFEVSHARAVGVPLRAITAPGKRAQADYALRVTRQVLPYFTRYFGVSYALPKLDQFAVPSVRWGAMEDWGLISYAEDDFLVDPQRSSPDTVRNVYATIAHEIAHQWFGNLVTAASWEEIWLNEAFATWLERKTTDHFNPDWQVPLQSRLPIDRAMTLDASSATRAIRSGPVRETAVLDVFDPITYAKGGMVLTMLEQWIGADTFQRGLAAYMKGQRLSNATAADLWHYIGRASGQNVTRVAASWTDQQGFPLLQVSSTCEGGRQRLALAQSRFSSTGQGNSTQSWQIPVRWARGPQTGTMLMDAPQRTLELGACSDVPAIVNAGGGGFYRVAYEPAAQRALTQRFAQLAPADRVTLLSDTFALMQSGRLPLQAYFDILEGLPRVNDASRTLLWTLAGSELDFLDKAMAGRPAQKQVRGFGRTLLAPQLAQLGWAPPPGEDAQTAELRGTLVALLARFDHAPTIEQATRAFDDDDAGRRPLPASLREAVTIATGMHADRAHFDRLLARLKAAQGEEERWMLVKALASGRDEQRAQELLAAALAGVAPPNVATAIPGQVARRSPFGEHAYRYTLQHWPALADMAGAWGRMFLLPDAAAGFSTPEQAGRLVDDQRSTAGANGDKLAAQEAENIRLRAAVKAREAPALEKGLAD